MRSLKFPKMFNSNSTAVWNSADYNKMTLQNAELLLESARNTLLGDPYFGNMLRLYLFDQNNYVLRDAVVDTIYDQLALFLPQLRVNRDNIDIISGPGKGTLHCTFRAISQIDYQMDTYSIALLTQSENNE